MSTRATFVLVPGAGGNASYWDELLPELESRGHEVIPVDIAEDDPTLGLPEYAEITEAAIAGRDDVVLVAQSLGGFTAPMVATRVPLRMIVLVNAMIPLPGEKPGDWWGATGALEARLAADEDAGRSTDFDVERHFLHDVPEDVQARMFTQSPPREPADTPFAQPCEFERWPDIPVRVLVGTDDRFFPAEFQRRVAMDRLAVDVDEIEAGHLVALSNPTALADRLVGYLGED